ncbi:MAG TPA: hypothetical protein VGR46_14315, partial [Candidatus Limnocylindria bacterium]|nr:hypothetical protein [Candidatus Limnocylindria bacterium]
MGAVAVAETRGRQQNTFAVLFLVAAMLATQLPLYVRAGLSLATASDTRVDPARIAPFVARPSTARADAAQRARVISAYGRLPMTF